MTGPEADAYFGVKECIDLSQKDLSDLYANVAVEGIRNRVGSAPIRYVEKKPRGDGNVIVEVGIVRGGQPAVVSLPIRESDDPRFYQGISRTEFRIQR